MKSTILELYNIIFIIRLISDLIDEKKMGNIRQKTRLDYATMNIKIESKGLVFDGSKPLLAFIEIDS